MGWLSSNQVQHQSSENNSTNNMQGNLASNPLYQQYAQGFGSLANSSIDNIQTPTNPFGQQAGTNQAGIAGNLNPAFAAAGNASSGTTYGPNSYQPFMSPYTQDVTNALRQQFGTTMGQVGEQVRGNLASQGALGNSNNPVAISNALAPIANAENTAIAQNIQQGFNTANQNAQEAGRFQLSGANTLAGLTGAATGANTGLANIGQGLFGNQIQSQEFPAQLANLYNKGWGDNNAIQGYNTTSHGTGTSDSTTTKNPSLFSDIMGVAGMVAGLAANGGVIHPYASGGAVIDLDPVLLAHLIKGMPPSFHGYAEGGDVQDDKPPSLKEMQLRPYISLLEDLEKNGPRALPVDHGEIKPNTDWVLERGGLPAARAADALQSVGDFGKSVAMQPFHAGEAVAEAAEHPSLGSITHAGAQTAMAALRPLAAAKIMGAGYGTGLVSSALERIPSLTTTANAEGASSDPLDASSRARLTALQKKQSSGQTLTRAEREEQNSYIGILASAQKAAAEADAEARRIRESGIASAEAKRLADEAELERQKNLTAKGDYDSAIMRAEASKAKALGSDTRYSDSWLRDVYEKTGGVPGLTFTLAAGLGGIDKMAKGPAKSLSDYLRLGGEGAGAGMLTYNGPLAYDTFGAPARNPEKEAYLGYARDLPEGHPLKDWAAKYAATLPDANPTRTTAADEFYDLGKAAKRTLAGGAEGALSAISGSAGPAAIANTVRGVGNIAKDAILGTADTVGSIPGTVMTAYHKGMGRAATAKEAAQELQRNASDASRSATASRADALAARDDLAEAVLRSNGQKGVTDQSAFPRPEPTSASAQNSGMASGIPSVGVDKTPVFDAGQGEQIAKGIEDLKGLFAAQNKAAEVARSPVLKELPAPRPPNYANKHKQIAQPFIVGRANEGSNVPSTSEVMSQFDKANLKQPSFKTVDERVGNADALLAKIYANNPGITPNAAAKMLGEMLANPKKIPLSEWGLPKEFILPSVAAPIAASALSGDSGNSREGHADGGMISPDTHALPEDHSWEHRGIGSKVRGPDGSFVPMSVAQPVAQRKRGGKVPYSRNYAHGGVVVGPVMGATGGRTDAKPVNVPANSYVIPADVVSGLPGAEGNTVAGMHILEKHMGLPWHASRSYANGGAPHKPVPILISDGEFVVTPEMVAKHGGGDVKQGHRVLDSLVKKVRAMNITKLKTLPAPAR